MYETICTHVFFVSITIGRPYMKYKFSKYNLICDEYAETYLVFNTKSTCLVELDKSFFAISDKNKKIIEGSLSENEIELLSDLGIIVPYMTDETEKIKYEAMCGYFNQNDIFYLTIAPTYACNMKCPYCFQDEQENIVMTNETIGHILSFLKNIIGTIKHLEVRWFGGEPTLCIDIIEFISKQIINLCEENSVTYSSNIITNGILINKDVLNRFLEWHINYYQITLGGRATHDEQRIMKNGEKTYHTLLKTIKMISEKAIVAIRCNVFEQNVKDICLMIDDVFSIVEKKENLRFLLHPVSNFNEGASKDSQFEDYCRSSIYSKGELIIVKKLLEYVGHEQISNLNFQPAGLVCMAQTMNKLVIDSHGHVYKCEVAMQRVENNISEISDLAQSVDVLFNKKNSRWMFANPDDSCMECKMLPLCMSGCLVQRFNNHQRKVCALYKDNLKELIKLRYSSIVKGNGRE